MQEWLAMCLQVWQYHLHGTQEFTSGPQPVHPLLCTAGNTTLVRGSGAKPVNVQAMVDLEEAPNVQAHLGDAAHDNNAAHLEHILFASKEVQLYDRVFARTERQRWKA